MPQDPTPPNTTPETPPAPNARRLFLPLMLAMMALLIWFGPTRMSGRTRIPYSAFKDHLAAGEVQQVWLEEQRIRGRLQPGVVPGNSGERGGAGTGGAGTGGIGTGREPPAPGLFESSRVHDEGLVAELEEAAVTYEAVPPNPFLNALGWLLPFGLLVLVMMWLMRGAARRMGGAQGISFGKSRARLVPEHGTGVTFDDVAGCDEAKAELSEMVEFLRQPDKFTALGAKIPKGVLLLGPPGSGKTLLARAVAGEAKVPFFSINGSDFVEMFVGVGAARVRDLFKEAKKRAPCIVFIDEIDAVGRQRGVSMGVVNDEREQTLNQLLSEMDGFEANSGVILLAATNRPEILDRALLRPGRFDRQVVLDAPDLEGRLAILEVHGRDKRLASEVDLRKIAQATVGMTGADLANALNEAALAAARQGSETIDQDHLEEAVEKVVAGPERRSRRLAPEEKRRVAWHEAGHALVALSCPGADPVTKISVVPRGRAALGYTMQLPQEERYLRTRSELEERLAILLGGRTAEKLGLGEASTGAGDDLRSATALARQMVCVFGMSERLGPAQCAREAGGQFLSGEEGLTLDGSQETAALVDNEVRELLDQAAERALSILTERRADLERVVEALLERETLDRAALDELLPASAS
ncbi:MAG: ATP-dependent zinc metalloprotease FtsH [Planctomycetota bacterium]